MRVKLTQKQLVEYSIAGLLILILLTVSIPRFQNAQLSKDNVLAMQRLDDLDKAFKKFKNDYGRFPQKTTMMTAPDLYRELLNGKYITHEQIKDPYIGPNETTNDGDPSSLFWDNANHDKFQLYNSTTNHYRGRLPGKYVYDIGSAGPDKVINMDNPGGMMLLEKRKILDRLSQVERSKEITHIISLFQTFIDYDPSNGIISDGDIHVLGP